MQRHADYLQTSLDDLTERAQILRAEALRLIDERASIDTRLKALTADPALARCEEVDRDEIRVRAEHLQQLLDSISVGVSASREPVQAASFAQAQEQIAALKKAVQAALEAGEDIPLEAVRSALNAASPEPISATVDERFQSIVLGCALSDQKALRKRLAELLDTALAAEAEVRAMSEEERAALRERAKRAAQPTVPSVREPATDESEVDMTGASAGESEAGATPLRPDAPRTPVTVVEEDESDVAHGLETRFVPAASAAGSEPASLQESTEGGKARGRRGHARRFGGESEGLDAKFEGVGGEQEGGGATTTNARAKGRKGRAGKERKATAARRAAARKATTGRDVTSDEDDEQTAAKPSVQFAPTAAGASDESRDDEEGDEEGDEEKDQPMRPPARPAAAASPRSQFVEDRDRPFVELYRAVRAGHPVSLQQYQALQRWLRAKQAEAEAEEAQRQEQVRREREAVAALRRRQQLEEEAARAAAAQRERERRSRAAAAAAAAQPKRRTAGGYGQPEPEGGFGDWADPFAALFGGNGQRARMGQPQQPQRRSVPVRAAMDEEDEDDDEGGAPVGYRDARGGPAGYRQQPASAPQMRRGVPGGVAGQFGFAPHHGHPMMAGYPTGHFGFPGAGYGW